MAPPRETTHAPASIFPTLVVIGASTGGPKAVAQVLHALSEDLGAAVATLIHVGAGFAPRMGVWLDTQTKLTVRLIKAGARPLPGMVYFPDGLDHVRFGSTQIFIYTQEPEDLAYRPCIDTFLHSVARHWLGPVIGVLLTSMGNDGTEGLRALRQMGAHTIAQDKATSVIYSMPKIAWEIGAVRQMLPLDQIATAISMRVPSLSAAQQEQRRKALSLLRSRG